MTTRPEGRKPSPGHRALRKGRVSVENTAYFVTACTSESRPVFRDPACAHVMVEAVRWLRRSGRIWLLGYIVMPDHVHLAFALREQQAPSRVIGVLKGFVARRLGADFGVARPVWQPGFQDRAIRDLRQARAALAYIQDNPVRAGLCPNAQEYPFSSANPPSSGEIDWWWLA